MHNIDLVIFDMDGVLLDSEWVYEVVKKRLCASLGLSGEEVNSEAFIGRSSWLFWQEILNSSALPGNASLLVEQQFTLALAELKQARQPESPGLTPLLRSLKSAGLRTAVASGSAGNFIRDVLDYLRIDSYFDCVVTGNDVADLKPAPDIYLETLKRMAAPACRAIAVEDSPAGCEAAQEAGLLCVGYTNHGQNRQDLRKAEYLIDDLLQLESILDNYAPLSAKRQTCR